MNGVLSVLTVVPTAGFEAAAEWYERFLGRPADRRPMDGCWEWQLADGGGIQLFRDAEHAGGTQVTLAVEDVDGLAAGLAARGVPVEEPADVPSGQFRLTTVTDPDGNSFVLAQQL